MKLFTMYDAMLRVCFFVSISFCAYQIYSFGYLKGVGKMERTNPHVRARMVTEGNVIKYPFGETRREAPTPSDSNRSQQNREEPETA